MHNAKNKQQGAALLMALLIVAVVAIIASAALSEEHFIINRSISLNEDAQMQAAAYSARIWAEEQLRQSEYKQQWPLTMNTFRVNGTAVNAILVDLQGRFNVNNMASGDSSGSFQQLLEAINAKIHPPLARDLGRAVSAWFLPLSNPASLDSVYAQMNPPYRSGHQMMVSISELRLVSGFDEKHYQVIAPYLAALPDNHTPINVNTASIPVLMSAVSGMSQLAAQEIVQQRSIKPFTSISDFKQFPIVKNLSIEAPLTVQSTYFLLTTRISLGGQALCLETLLQRESSHDSVVIKPLWQVRSLG
ncbi:MAG: hypothetical protein CMF39_03840 [Legionellaceae bacterium]|nr:hypothetical protein [Legionellaceae bacterium]